MPGKLLVRFNALGPNLSPALLRQFRNGSMNSTQRTHLVKQLEWFFGLDSTAITDVMLDHVIEVPVVLITPSTKKLEERIIGPLASTRRLYCLSEYLGTIAVCGILGEMFAILLWDVNISPTNEAILRNFQRNRPNKSFEDLGQSERIEVLGKTNLVRPGSDTLRKFNELRALRRPYMHLLSAGHSKIREDARRAFGLGLGLFQDVFQIRLVNAGSVSINPAILKLFK